MAGPEVELSQLLKDMHTAASVSAAAAQQEQEAARAAQLAT